MSAGILQLDLGCPGPLTRPPPEALPQSGECLLAPLELLMGARKPGPPPSRPPGFRVTLSKALPPSPVLEMWRRFPLPAPPWGWREGLRGRRSQPLAGKGLRAGASRIMDVLLPPYTGTLKCQ